MDLAEGADAAHAKNGSGGARAGEGLIVVINADAGRVRKLGPKALRQLVSRCGPSDLARVVTTDRHDIGECLIEAGGRSG